MLDSGRNFAKGTVDQGYNASDSVIGLLSGQGLNFPSPPFNATWWNSTEFSDPSDDPSVEIIRVVSIQGDSFQILRGQEGTSPRNHNSLNQTYKLIAGITAKLITDILLAFAPNGIVATSVITVNSDLEMTADHNLVLVDASNGPVVVTLLNAQGQAGRQFFIKKIDGSTNVVTILGRNDQTIDRLGFKSLRYNDYAVTLVSNGLNWFII